MPLNRSQLEIAANDAFYLVQQMFLFFSWETRLKPLAARLPSPMHSTIVENGVIEAQLLYYRKLNEFFLDANRYRTDELKSSLFGYASNEGFLHKLDIIELHKRIAHPTTRQAEFGPISYGIYDASYAGLNHSIPFLRHLAETFHPRESQESRSLHGSINVFRQLWHEWSLSFEPSQRLSLIN